MEENKNIPENEACKGACNENEAKKEKKSGKCKALEERIRNIVAYNQTAYRPRNII